MYILLKTNETNPPHNVMLIKVRSICDCVDPDQRSETTPPPHPHPNSNTPSLPPPKLTF